MKRFFLNLFLFSGYLLADMFPFDPPKNFSLYPAFIAVDHPVTTDNPIARQYFNQGLTLVYAFNHDAAYWSFKRAAEQDPEMPMAYWGMALTLGQNINIPITPKREQTAFQLIRHANQIASKATESEQDYIKALSERYTDIPNPDLEQLTVNYKNAMKKLTEKYPDDLDAATLYAESILNTSPWHQWDRNGNPLPGTMEAVNTLESVLRADPNHLGANHYYIHTVEASKHPERALMSAERLQTLLPASGHILHMPSHIFFLVGDYHQAALSNEKAVKADQEYIEKFGTYGIYPVHYMSHNLDFLSRSYSMEGRFEDAFKAGKALVEFYTPHFKMMPEMEYYAPTAFFVLLRFHKWENVLDVPPPPKEMRITRILWNFARAMAFTALGSEKQAQEEVAIFETRRAAVPPDLKYGLNDAGAILAIAHHVLQSKKAEMDDRNAEAISEIRKAVAIQDQLNYSEPPDWFYPVRETLGGLLLRQHQFEEAEQVFRKSLEKYPRNGRALYGLLASLKAQGRHTDAFWVRQAFTEAWQYSDTPLSIKDL